MAATAATNYLMSLNTQPLKSSASSSLLSLRQANTQRQPQYTNNSSNKSFDEVFDKYNSNQSAANTKDNDVVNVSSDKVQETKDPAAAVVSSASAQGKSENTQDAPQKKSQAVEETAAAEVKGIESVEETDDPADPNKITVMNLFVPLGIDDVQNLNAADVNIQENDSPNLMTIIPQSQESNDKSQDMLNLLAGRTWKINPQSQSVNQMDVQAAPIFTDELSLQLSSQQPQVQNNLSLESNANPVLLQDLSTIQRNLLDVTPQAPLNEVDTALIETTEEVDDLTAPLPSSNLVQTENLNSIPNENVILNNTAKVNPELPVQNVSINSDLPQIEQQSIPLTNAEDAVDGVKQQFNQEQFPKQDNAITEQPLVSMKQEQFPKQDSAVTEQPLVSVKQEQQPNINIDAQPLQQSSQTQSTAQTGSQPNTNMLTSTQQTNVSEVEQPLTAGNIQAQPLDQPPVHQSQQPQQVTYQAQQIRPAAQAETVEIPQVQAAIAESQPEFTNRQQPLPLNPADLVASEGELDRTQILNPVQQVLQQQSQNQQQQNFQSQMQQTAASGTETEGSANAEQQTPAENFAAHLGAAVNNTNSEPVNVSNEQPEQVDQTARQENITTQIVEHARMIRNAENTEMVIQLKPEHLGELTLRVSATSNGSVNVTFHSENAQVRAMLENTLVQLKQELSNQGLKVENVQVSAHLSDGGMMNGRGQQAWEQNQRSSSSRIGRIGRTEGGRLTAAEEAEIISTTVTENIVTADGVDYRV